MSAETLVRIAAAIAGNGLILRGGFTFGTDESRPAGPSGAPARSVLLVGNAGAGYWTRFMNWRSTQPPDTPNPLDRWSRNVIGAVAERFEARVLMPNDRPFAPFQQWAMRAKGLRPSPLGILMHPDYGLWHAWRGALLFDQDLAVEPPSAAHPCDGCEDQPCLAACPVAAFSDAGFDYEGCAAHLRGPGGGACRSGGCLARNACPVGAGWRYPAEVQAFHQKAFAGL